MRLRMLHVQKSSDRLPYDSHRPIDFDRQSVPIGRWWAESDWPMVSLAGRLSHALYDLGRGSNDEIGWIPLEYTSSHVQPGGDCRLDGRLRQTSASSAVDVSLSLWGVHWSRVLAISVPRTTTRSSSLVSCHLHASRPAGGPALIRAQPAQHAPHLLAATRGEQEPRGGAGSSYKPWSTSEPSTSQPWKLQSGFEQDWPWRQLTRDLQAWGRRQTWKVEESDRPRHSCRPRLPSSPAVSLALLSSLLPFFQIVAPARTVEVQDINSLYTDSFVHTHTLVRQGYSSELDCGSTEETSCSGPTNF